MSKYCPLGQVFAFEPNPDLTTIITQNIAINNCKNITFYPYAAGAENKIAYFHLHQENSFLGQITNELTEVPIPVRRLDDLKAITKIDLIKIDAEGTEIDVLKGCSNILIKDKPVIIIELWDHSLPEGIKLLTKYGYRLSHAVNDNYLATAL